MGSHSQKPIILSLLLYGIVTIVGIIAGKTLAASVIVPYLKARSWKKTRATIIFAAVSKQGVSVRSRKCQVTYTYHVPHGRSFTGTRLTLNGARIGLFERSLCLQVKKTQKEGRATCFYDPANPKESVLIRSFNHMGFCAGLLVLSLLGGSGLVGVTRAAEKLMRKSTATPGRIDSEEQDLPLVPAMTGLFSALLSILAVCVSGITLANGEFNGLLSLGFGVFYVGVAIYCAIHVRRSSFSGALIFPAKGKGVTTLCIPSELGGDISLEAIWVGRSCVPDVKPSDLRFVEVRDNTSDMTEIDILHLPPMPDQMREDGKLRLKVCGTIGQHKYLATFFCADRPELQKAVNAASTIVVVDDCTACLSGDCDVHGDD